MPSYVTPKKNTAFKFYVSLVDQSNTKLTKANPTIAAGDFKVSTDGGAFANLTTLPSANPAAGRAVMIDLATTEMNGDNIVVQCVDAAGAEWCDLIVNIQTSARQIDDLAYPATTGRFMVVDASGLVDANMVKVGPTGSGTAQTAGDIMADTNDIQTRLPAALVSGRMDVSVGAMAANVLTAAATAADFTTEVTAGLSTLDAAGVRTAVGLASANLDTQLTTIDDFLDTEVAAIKAKTDNLPASPASTTNITAGTITTVTNLTNAPTAGDLTAAMKTSVQTAADAAVTANTLINTLAGYVDTEVAAIKAKTDQLTFSVSNSLDSNVTAIGNSTTALTAFKNGVQGNVIGVIGTGSSTTSLVTSSTTPTQSVADQTKGRIITFLDTTTTAALRGQSTDITGATASATPTLTVTALTTAPVSGDTFVIT